MARTGYTDIAAYYRQQIDDGALEQGGPMPSMRDVTEKFKVSITTANRAYQLLKHEGYTVAKAGVGTVVANRTHIVATGAARIDRLTRTDTPYTPGETSTDHVAMMRSCADPDIATQLGIELYDEIVIRRRVFRKDGRPTVVAVSCIHPRALAAVPELMTQGQLKPFWQVTYRERTGKEVNRSPERRGARLASTDELNALEVEAPPSAAVPVLVLHTTHHDEDGPIEVWEDVHAPGLWQVSE
ncbi:GntR family transcriptional regulator [Streptomyces scopuliridis]|uniref:GntR family transcriptional regulator n=1 Tax=Streptomyces scopuliridis TaxID=452529 RepID=A0ACD4ZZ40_9ACTN|nr:GntR family transcriptional regulator [Streptomyces scopuliridis]WSC03588.1 GntR family transcriptional regulator [Streptomyces scopuliridis]